ncbi:MAG: TetR/AcrR family transcriptional regulator [Brevibacillus sp.]|nr:TetR/AcrR family transcriptional regulator [Brevibacillus sp.]
MAARKAAEQELSREQILEAARSLFAQKGYRAVSMRGIASQLGCSHGAIYYHFRDKAELFCALVEQGFQMLRAAIETALSEKAGNADKLRGLERVMMAFVRFGMEHPHHYEIMFLVNDPEIMRYSQPGQVQCYERFAEIVRSAVEGRWPVSGGMFTVPWSLFLSLHGFVTHYILTGQAYGDIVGLAETHIRLLVRSISS